MKSIPKRRTTAPAAPEPGTRERVLQVARAMIAKRGNAAISLVDGPGGGTNAARR